LIIAAILNGFGAGILWCALGEYISESATDKSKGYMNGLFWFWYMGSQAVGPQIAATVLREGYKTTFMYATLALLGFISWLSFFFIRKPLPHLMPDLVITEDEE